MLLIIYIICAIACYRITIKEGFGKPLSAWLALGGPISLIFVLLVNSEFKQ